MENFDDDESDVDFDEEEEIECSGLGQSIYFDEELKDKFWISCIVADLTIKIGDCVRIRLEQNNYGYAQITAIYEDEKDEMKLEVQWFLSSSDFKDIKYF
jgi:hypothetical protein